jgi:hypothetical protein
MEPILPDRNNFATTWQWLDASLSRLACWFLLWCVLSNLVMRPWALPVCVVYRATRMLTMLIALAVAGTLLAAFIAFPARDGLGGVGCFLEGMAHIMPWAIGIWAFINFSVNITAYTLNGRKFGW